MTPHGCIICGLRPLAIFGNILGTIPLQFSCLHSPEAAPQCGVTRSWTSAVRNVAVTSFLAASLYISGDRMRASWQENASFTLLIYQFLQTFQVSLGVVANIMGLAQFRNERLQLEALKAVIDHVEWYTLEYLFGRASEGELRRSVLTNIGVCVLYMFVPSVFLLAVRASAGRMVSADDFFDVFSASLALLCFSIRISAVFTSLAIYKHVFIALGDQIKQKMNSVRKSRFFMEDITIEDALDILEMRHDTVKNFLPDIDFKDRGCEVIPLSNEISRLQRLYLSLNINIKYINHAYDPLIIICFVGVILYVGISSYILVVTAIDNMDVHFTIYCGISLLFSLLFVLYGVSCLEALYNPIVELESFVYNYPITGLSSEEATAIAMFMMALHDRPPIFTASQLFQLRADIVFSIFGTVLTYVIMGLQFKMASS